MGRIVFGDSFIGGFRGNCSCLASRSYALLGYELFFKFLLSSLIPASNSDPYLYVRRISDHSGSCSHVWSLHLIPSSVSLAMGRHILPDLERDVNHTLLHSPVHISFRSPETIWEMRDQLGEKSSSVSHPATAAQHNSTVPTETCGGQIRRKRRRDWGRDGLQVGPRQGQMESINFRIQGNGGVTVDSGKGFVAREGAAFGLGSWLALETCRSQL